MKPDQTAGIGSSRMHKTVSPEEIIAAGGATAFGLRTGKTTEALIKALESCPKPEPFTDEEWEDLLIQMANDK